MEEERAHNLREQGKRDVQEILQVVKSTGPFRGSESTGPN